MNATLFDGTLVKSNRIIYTPSDFAKTNLIHLQEIGELQAQKPHTSNRKGLSSFLFILVLKGAGSLEYEKKLYSLAEGSCVFIDCAKPYFHRTSENLWKLKWIHFYGPNLNSIYKKYKERGGNPCFAPNNFHEFELNWTTLYNIAVSDSYVKDMKIYESLTSLLTLLMESSWNPNQNTRGSATRQNLQPIKEYLDCHYTEKITLEMLSKLFFINKFYLARIFKAQFGMSINNYLLQMKITHAKHLLRFSSLSIEKIAQDCGISDPNYFTRVFKKIEGMTPGEYRKSW